MADRIIELPFDRAFLAIQAIDRVTGFPNPNGIFSASFEQDGEVLSSFKMENIGYDKTRYLNGHIDYVAKMKGGAYYQMIFPPKEFGLDIYTRQDEKNYFELSAIPVDYALKVADANKNISLAVFQVKRKPGQMILSKEKGS